MDLLHHLTWVCLRSEFIIEIKQINIRTSELKVRRASLAYSEFGSCFA